MELTVVHSNDLVEASYNLSIDEVRLIAFSAMKVDSRKENVGEILIRPSEFSKAFGLDKKNTHRNLVNAIKSLASKSVTVSLDHKRNMVLPWLSMGVYDKQSSSGSHVVVEFSPKIEPYLFELKERFTSINFEYAARLNTPISFRLYQWLIKAKNLKSHNKGGTTSVILEVDWIKSQSGLNGKYAEWGNFSKRVIAPAIQLINGNTDISVIWEPIKTGRKVTAIEFNYIEDKMHNLKPLRPRLYRRPKVFKGSHEEGVWMRKNAELLLDYMGNSLEYDPNFKLTISDLKKLIAYVSIYDSNLERQLKLELKERQRM